MSASPCNGRCELPRTARRELRRPRLSRAVAGGYDRTGADHEHRTAQPGQFVLHLGRRQHAIDGGVTRRIVAEPARPVSLEPPDVAAKLVRIAVPHRFFDGKRHALGLDLREAREHRGTAVGRDAGRGAAGHDGAGASGVTRGEMQRDRAADGNAHQRDLSCDAVAIEQGRDIVGHGIDGKLAPHLLRQARAAAIVTQAPGAFRRTAARRPPSFRASRPFRAPAPACGHPCHRARSAPRHR